MSLRDKTAPQVLVERARATPDAIAFRSKHLGLYRERSWSQYASLVGRCARGLQGLGLAAGERVAIMGDACEEWMICDLAAQAAGAITYGIYPTASSAELEYQMRDGDAAVFVAENQEYVDKLLPLLERLPALRHIVVIDGSAMFEYDHALLVPYEQLLKEGTGNEIGQLEALVKKLDPAAPAFIVYTSGTTGNPKGALIAHGTHLAATQNLIEHYPALGNEAHRTVVYLPLCHILGRDVAITLPLIGSLVPHFGEDIEDLPTTLFEVAPTVLFAVPRYLQKFASQVLIGIGTTTALKRAAYEVAMNVGRAQARKRWDGSPEEESFLYQAVRALVFRPLLEKLGMDRLELVICGGAPLPQETMALWQVWGVNLVEIYGQTEEAGAIISGQKSPFPRPGNVGTVAAGWELTLGEGNEIRIRGAHVFERYWGNDEATRQVKMADGWLRTGDVGALEQGLLRLVDRARDFIVTAGGKTLSPSSIENALRSSPYVAEAMVIGHARKYLTALIEIDFDTVADWARAQDVSYTGFTSLAGHPAVDKLIAAEVQRANEALARVEQIKAFRILPKVLDPEEEGEPVTPTRKLKRSLMLERFRELVESMYDDREERLVQAGVGDLLQPAPSPPPAR
jgi:long-chain acyl-CoA synthetase